MGEEPLLVIYPVVFPVVEFQTVSDDRLEEEGSSPVFVAHPPDVWWCLVLFPLPWLA